METFEELYQLYEYAGIEPLALTVAEPLHWQDPASTEDVKVATSGQAQLFVKP